MGDYHAFSPLGEPTPGDVPIAQSDGSVMWGPQTGAVLTNLSTVLFVDVGTSVAPTNRNGNIETPFMALQDAIDANPVGGTVILAPGSYGVGITLGLDAQFSGMSAKGATGPVTIGELTVSPNVSAWFENATVAFIALNNATVEFLNCQAEGIFGDGTGAGLFIARLSSLGNVTGTAASFIAFQCECEVVSVDNASFDNCSFAGNITAVGALSIRRAKSFSAGLTITATTIDIDAESLRLAVFAGVTFVGTVSGFEGSVLYWGKLSGITVGVFVPPGAGKQNYTGMSTSEANTQIFAPRRGVLCFLIGLSSATFKFTARKNGVDTALTVTVSNNTQSDNSHFIEYAAGDLIGIAAQNGGDPIATGSAQLSAVFV